MRKIEVKVHCHTCKRLIIRRPSTVQPHNYCNRACYYKELQKKWTGKRSPYWKGGKKEVSCLICGTKFRTYYSVFCSHPCYAKYRSRVYRGSNHHHWKGSGGRTTKPIRSREEYEKYQHAIVERDKHCMRCGSTKELHAHHIIPLAEIVADIKAKNGGKINFKDKRLYDMKNGMTLCAKCHRVEHKKMGRIAGTPIKIGQSASELRGSPKKVQRLGLLR